MLHHLAIEVAPDLMAAEGDFWLAAGFERVSAPEVLGGGFDWYEREGTQIHLMATVDPAIPPRRGHVAVVAPDFDLTVARMKAGGFELAEGRELWGAKRAKTKSPTGYVVELMEFSPPPLQNRRNS